MRGLAELRRCVDTVVTIPNDRLLSTLDPATSVTQAFMKADDVLRQAIQGISDLILTPGLINLDFADVRTIMSGRGLTIMGTGVGHGENRAVDAVRQAITSPLLEDMSVDGARGVLVNVTGGEDLAMSEVGAAATIIQEAVHKDANIVFGAVVDPTMDGGIKITVIATGFDEADGALTPSGGDRRYARRSRHVHRLEPGHAGRADAGVRAAAPRLPPRRPDVLRRTCSTPRRRVPAIPPGSRPATLTRKAV